MNNEYLLFADCDFLEPSHVLGFCGFDPRNTCHGVDDHEECEEHDGESIAKENKQAYSRDAVDEPIDPRVRLTIDEPVIGEEGGRYQESVEQECYHFSPSSR